MTFQKLLLGISLLIFQSCSNDGATKDQAKNLSGKWKLISIKVIDTATLKDTAWSTEGCFIRFGYHGKLDASPITYALAFQQVIDAIYSIPSPNRLLIVPPDPVSEYASRKVGLPVSQQNSFDFSGSQLIFTGDCVILGENNSLTSGKKMKLIAVFER
jgi:hypothetical protein